MNFIKWSFTFRVSSDSVTLNTYEIDSFLMICNF